LIAVGDVLEQTRDLRLRDGGPFGSVEVAVLDVAQKAAHGSPDLAYRSSWREADGDDASIAHPATSLS